MKYKYLYQDKQNKSHEGVIDARDRADAFTKLRKSGIRPYRVIGNDPWNWRPWAISVSMFLIFLIGIGLGALWLAEKERTRKIRYHLSEQEAKEFREMAEAAVYRSPEAYRYNVWRGVNQRLVERGLNPIPKPKGLLEEEQSMPFGSLR